MKLFVYDCEVLMYDWIVVFKEYETDHYTVIHNDNEELRNAINPEDVYFGFNSKSYDQYIIRAIAGGFNTDEVKAVNDWIIGGGAGWEYPGIPNKFSFNNVDLRDDMQKTLSLKSIEGHLGMDIEESSVPFNLERPLTGAELQETIDYCKHDVDATERLLDIRKDYILTKSNLGKRAGIDPRKAMSLTNAKLTALMLNAKRVDRNDGRNYVYPENLDKTAVPEEVLRFFDQIRDLSIPDDDLFSRSLETSIGDMPVKYGWGGVHGSVTGYYGESTSSRVIQNRDVSSLYPTLLVQYNYLSRNVPDPELFYQIRRDRLEAKHNGDKRLAKDLKLPLNTVSGAQENEYNDLYDPLPTRSLRISGELFLTVLLTRLVESCKTFTPLNFNTDGLAYEVDRNELPLVDRICTEWEAETGFELELDEIGSVWIKDVNNLLIIKADGEVKTVGGYLNYGISEKGAWGINNNYIIVKKALRAYMVDGTPIRETIKKSEDLMEFQIIAHASSKYDSVFQMVDGEQKDCQKTNRVYAVKDKQFGTLYKVKAGSAAKIPNLPPHCRIDNNNEEITLKDIDKEWYINLANKMLSDFKKEKQMAEKKTETTKMSALEKLLNVRIDFMNEGVKKSGKNFKLSYKYFELEDIIPQSNPIFAKYRLIPITSFTNDEAKMTIRDLDSNEQIIFSLPMREIEPTLSSATGNEVTNAIQRLGAVVTYQRRYLYMIALDIVESDEIEASTGENEVAKPTPRVTPEKRVEVKNELTDTAENASDLQIKQLKKILKKLLKATPEKEELVTQLALQTDNFKKISKGDCEKLIIKLNKMIGGDDAENNMEG